MSFSTLSHKFLVDENVKIILLRFLESEGFDTKFVPKTAADLKVASISKEEERIIITNDQDFQWYSDKEIFSVVLLKVPQKDNALLIKSFHKLLSECNNFSGKIIVVDSKSWKAYPLVKKLPGLIMRT